MTDRRHAAFVRATHWLNAIAVVGLIVSGIAILLAHPRLYWGETGAVGTPALIDLPIPFLLGHSGWGRYLHFLSAWLGVAAAAIYLALGVASRHFQRRLLSGNDQYSAPRRATYAVVVFLLAPLVLLSGLAFSPALASVAPPLVTMFGGQQSARTIHFFAAAAVAVFFIVHVVMVWRSGFIAQTRAMVTGGARLERT
jgi:thiosulfate reductase cytochrome b subunit